MDMDISMDIHAKSVDMDMDMDMDMDGKFHIHGNPAKTTSFCIQNRCCTNYQKGHNADCL